ncbi:MAG: F0F1 ATP synthase subunit B [Candidatus Gracilibacteria bacterium]
MELIDKLGIDLKLLLAQVVNFLILLFILKKLVYKPVLKLLDARKNMIAKTVEDSKKMEERIQKLEDEKKSVMSKASKEAMTIVENAKKDAEVEHQKILEKAKGEISGMVDRCRTQIVSEKNAMMKDIRREVAGLVIMSSQKILQREFSEADQKKLREAIAQEVRSVKK